MLDFDGFPPVYKKAAENLAMDIASTDDFSQQSQKFQDFCTHYTVVPDLWKLWIQ